MDNGKIDRIFKEWQSKSMLTKEGALRVDPNVVRCLKLCLPLFLILIPVALASVLFFTLTSILFDIIHHNSAGFLPLLIIGIYYLLGLKFPVLYSFPLSVWAKFTHVCESAFLALMEPLLLPYLRSNPILLFHKDHVVASSGWLGKKRVFYYADLEKVVCPLSKKKGFCVQILFKGMDKPFVVDKKPALTHVAHLFSSAFQPIYVNEPLCEDMLRLYANMITLSFRKSQQDGLQCAMKHLTEPKYKDYDYSRRLPEYIDLLNRCKAQKSIPWNFYFEERCFSILRNKGADYDVRLTLLSHLFECAYASDDMVDDREMKRLSRIAYILCIKEWDFLSLKYCFESQKQKQYDSRTESAEQTKQRERYQSVCSSRKREACNLLGVKTDASLEEVKRAYRTQVKSCHPDTLPATAKDKEREEASIRFRTITEAYDFLCAELSKEPVSVAK